jgi:prophage regulatory protein
MSGTARLGNPEDHAIFEHETQAMRMGTMRATSLEELERFFPVTANLTYAAREVIEQAKPVCFLYAGRWYRIHSVIHAVDVRVAGLLKISEVSQRVGMNRSTIFGKVAKGEFPKPIKPAGLRSCWDATEVDIWLRWQGKTPVIAQDIDRGQ